MTRAKSADFTLSDQSYSMPSSFSARSRATWIWLTHGSSIGVSKTAATFSLSWAAVGWPTASDSATAAIASSMRRVSPPARIHPDSIYASPCCARPVASRRYLAKVPVLSRGRTMGGNAFPCPSGQEWASDGRGERVGLGAVRGQEKAVAEVGRQFPPKLPTNQEESSDDSHHGGRRRTRPDAGRRAGPG